jgi:probable rRNA maturation factor
MPSKRLLTAAAEMALAPLRSRCGGLPVLASLVCVGERRMRSLNARFTGRAELTDVLSFEEMEPDPESGCFRAGDVVICSEAARRQSRARGLSMRGELALYAVHGWLHLAGHRDGDAAGRARMVRAERRIMSRLGLNRD